MPACKKEKENLVPEQVPSKPKGQRWAIPANVAGTRYFEGTHYYAPSEVNDGYTKTTDYDSIRVDFAILTDTTLIMDIHSPTGVLTDTVLLSSYLSGVVYHPLHLYLSKTYGEPATAQRKAELYCDTSGKYMPRLTHWDGTQTDDRPLNHYLLKQMQ